MSPNTGWAARIMWRNSESESKDNGRRSAPESARRIAQSSRASPAAFQNPGNIAAARPRYEAEIEAADPRCGAVQHVEAVPFRPHHAKRLGDGSTGAKNTSAIEPGERPLPQDDHRRLRRAQLLGPSAFAARQGVQCLTAFAESLDREGQ